jgi:hypothetical protein
MSKQTSVNETSSKLYNLKNNWPKIRTNIFLVYWLGNR